MLKNIKNKKEKQTIQKVFRTFAAGFRYATQDFTHGGFGSSDLHADVRGRLG